MKLMLNGKEVSGMGHYVMAGDIKDATAEDSNVLSGKAYYNNNGKREGTMPNRGGMSAELSAGGSVSIPEGYHNGEGVVRAQDLESQTAGDAGAGNIDSGKTAWVNGVQVTGTSTKVDTSGATATAADIASGKTAYVQGVEVKGTLTGIMSVIKDIGITRTKEKSIPSGDWTHLYLKTKSSDYGQQVYLMPKNLSIYTLSSSFILTSGTSGVDSFSLSLDTKNQTLQSSVWMDDYFSELKAVKI